MEIQSILSFGSFQFRSFGARKKPATTNQFRDMHKGQSREMISM